MALGKARSSSCLRILLARRDVPRVPFGRGLARRNTHQRQPVIPAAEHVLGPLDEWRRHLTGDGYAVMGNLLASEEVIATMAGAFESHGRAPREAPRACSGGRRGGRRGQAGAPQRRGVRGGEPTLPVLDQRVDEHSDPVTELRRIYEVAKVELLAFMKALPTRKNPRGETPGETSGWRSRVP